MKLIKVRIDLRLEPGKPKMKYPDAYNAKEVDAYKVGPIVYEGRLSRGEQVEYCLIHIADEVADKYALEDGIEIVSEAEADVWLAQNPVVQEKEEEFVDDPNRLLAIIAKSLANIDLTQEDLDALDSSKPVKGIRRNPKIAEEFFPKIKEAKEIG